MKELLRVFNSRNIPVALLKGAYLAHTVYRDPALRPMHDLDLLVPEENRERSRQVLSDVGYEISLEPPGESQESLSPSLTCVHSDSVTDCVDLHWCVRSMDYYCLPASILWADASETGLFGCRVYVLSPELNFVHLVLHALNHTYLLRSWLDLALLWSGTSVESTRLLTLARCLGVDRPLYWGVRELTRNWGLDIPSAVGEAPARHGSKVLEDLVIRHRFRRYWRLVPRIAGLPGWRCRLAYVCSLLGTKL